jgi:hypothetical protein
MGVVVSECRGCGSQSGNVCAVKRTVAGASLQALLQCGARRAVKQRFGSAALVLCNDNGVFRDRCMGLSIDDVMTEIGVNMVSGDHAFAQWSGGVGW